MKKLVKKVLAAALTAVMAVSVLAGCGTTVKPENYSTTVVASLGDEKIYLDEAVMYLRSDQYYYEMMYTYLYGTSDIWDMEVSTGVTMADSLRESVMVTLRQTYILCSHAEELGVSLSEEDLAKIEEAVEESLTNTDATLLSSMNLSRDRLTEFITRNALANRVWEAVAAAADTNVSDDDARCVGASYVKIAEETESETEAEGETEEETIQPKVMAMYIYDAVRNGSTLEDAAAEYDLTPVTTTYFTGEIFEEDTLGYKAVNMKEGEVQQFHLEGDGYYVMVLDSEMDEEATESKRESIISSRQAEVFNAQYTEWQEASPEFKVEDKIWEAVSLDTVYIPAETEAVETTAAETEAIETTAAN